jgi:hypothetical protein
VAVVDSLVVVARRVDARHRWLTTDDAETLSATLA